MDLLKIELRDQKHLWVTYNPAQGDCREIIIDEEHKDIRICDGKKVVKVRFNEANLVKDILVNDVFVWQQE